MTLLRSSIVILFFATELNIIRGKVYKFDEYYETILQGKAKLDALTNSSDNFARKDPWGYYENGFEQLGNKIDSMLNKSRTFTFLSAKNKLKFLKLGETYKKWLKKYHPDYKATTLAPDYMKYA